VHQESVDDLSDVPDLHRTFLPQLNICVTDIDQTVKALAHGDHDDSGVTVVAESGDANALDTGVRAGDVPRALNRTPLKSVFSIADNNSRAQIRRTVVLQVERGGKLQYIVFQLD
jgi:S1-C subfamily serine protease